MKFGPVSVSFAVGAVLAHAMRATQRPYTLGLDYHIPKGTVLGPDHVADLAKAGHDHVVVAQLEEDDVSENEAATRIAHALVPDPALAGVRLTQAATGRVNIVAEVAGILHIDAAEIHRINAVDPMITLATLHPLRRVAASDMLATIKIISYAVRPCAVVAAQAAASAALTILRPVFSTATLIETTTKSELSDKGRKSLEARLDRLGLNLTKRVLVPHEIEALAAALSEAEGELVCILTDSATSDVMDTAPQALRAAGGIVDHFGMPVDPGNLLFIGRLGEKPVIGLPGCARSPALNGADWVLERLICGVTVGSTEIMAMGVGGLLKETSARGRPRNLSES